MIFYRINADTPFLVATQADARKAAKAVEAKHGRRMWEQVDVPTDKAGLMEYVNDLMERASIQAHNEDEIGLDIAEIAARDGAQAGDKHLTPAPSYSAVSIAIDDEWEKLPLARKLHFAALAMEDARSAL